MVEGMDGDMNGRADGGTAPPHGDRLAAQLKDDGRAAAGAGGVDEAAHATGPCEVNDVPAAGLRARLVLGACSTAPPDRVEEGRRDIGPPKDDAHGFWVKIPRRQLVEQHAASGRQFRRFNRGAASRRQSRRQRP